MLVNWRRSTALDLQLTVADIPSGYMSEYYHWQGLKAA